MRILALLTAVFILSLPALSQTSEIPDDRPRVLGGYLYQTAITPQSYLITSTEEFQPFASTLPPVTPYKNLPPPPNPDPFLKGFEVNFEESVLAVAVGRDRIKNPPVFESVQTLEDGNRLVHFTLSARTNEPYPFGWAVYTAVVLPRIDGETTVVVTTVPAKRTQRESSSKFPRL